MRLQGKLTRLATWLVYLVQLRKCLAGLHAASTNLYLTIQTTEKFNTAIQSQMPEVARPVKASYSRSAERICDKLISREARPIEISESHGRAANTNLSTSAIRNLPLAGIQKVDASLVYWHTDGNDAGGAFGFHNDSISRDNACSFCLAVHVD